jgi:outer membrane immunogenic protein
LTTCGFLAKTAAMKQLTCLTTIFCACVALALTALGGPEPLPSGKEMKQVAPAPPPECNWSGFYIGINVGGQWGHSEDKTDPSPHGYNADNNQWGYDESGVVAGGQVGYNFQWNWLVLGVEAEGGYMNLEGRGVQPASPGGDTHGESDSDFFTTIRGRLGFAFGHWLFYGSGGGIGVNYDTRVVDDCITSPCGGALIDGHKQEFDWGWAGGGGIEYMLACHWTIRADYLRYQLDDQHFSAPNFFPGRGSTGTFGWNAHTEGNIFRAALNYKF